MVSLWKNKLGHPLIFNLALPFLDINEVEHFHIKHVYDIPFRIIHESKQDTIQM